MVNNTRKPWAKPELHILNHKKTYNGGPEFVGEDEFFSSDPEFDS